MCTLFDSEYGDLLNIADQLLKGWTEHGTISYEQFVYREPRTWKFPKALSEIMKDRFGQDSLTFNWNTTGMGYTIAFHSAQVFALNRTGALPVSYIPGEDPALAPKVVPYEEEAYDWYAQMNNPTLVRVVQYAAIYQMFHNLGTAAASERAPAPTAPAAAFRTNMQQFWVNVDAVGGKDLDDIQKYDPIGARFARFNILEIKKAGKKYGIDPALLQALVGDEQDESAAKLRQIVRDDLATGLRAWQTLGEEGKQQLKSESASLEMGQVSQDARKALESARSLFAAVAAKRKFVEKYSKMLAPTGDSWIHTPAVVISSAGADDWASYGGANVRASVTSLGIRADAEIGAVKIEGNILRLNPADVDRAPNIVRMAARGMRSGEAPAQLEARLSRALADVPATPPRSAQVALAEPGAPQVRSAVSTVFSPQASTATVPESVAALAGPRPGNTLTVVKYGDHYWVTGPDRLPPVMASNLPDASELASLRLARSRSARQPTAELELHNFTEQEQRSALDEIRASSKRAGYSEDVVTVAGEGKGGYRRLSLEDYDFTNPVIRVEEPVVAEGERIAKVTVEVKARRAGFKNALIEFWIKVKEASAAQLTKITEAIRIRIAQVFGQGGAAVEATTDPVLLLHEEIKRLGKLHQVEIETRIRDAAGDWRLGALDGVGASRHA